MWVVVLALKMGHLSAFGIYHYGLPSAPVMEDGTWYFLVD